MEQVDKQKLINWLQDRWLLEAEDNEPERAGVYYGIKMCVESGVFDIQKEQPPKVSVGDKVYHTKLKYQGTIKSISKSGKTVRIIREGKKWADDGNIHIENIRLIEEVTDDK